MDRGETMPVPAVTLNDLQTIPQLGFGVWTIDNQDAPAAVKNALDVGYRHIDTAMAYHNEEGVGEGVRQSGVAREDVFITTKLQNPDQGYDSALRAFDKSLANLKMDYVDLYLIHWPIPKRDLYVESWNALIRLKNEGRAKSIGVCNFRVVDLERIVHETGVTPALNQIELHPAFQQNALRLFHEKNHIATQAWSPIARGALLQEPVLLDIAASHQRTVAQVILRWHMEIGNITIPKSQTPQRMQENFNIFDFQLTADDHQRIRTLDREDGRRGPHPDTHA